MNRTWGPILGLSLMTIGCGAIPGVPGLGECKFGKGELAANLTGDAKAFVETVLEVQKLQAEWTAEIKAIAGELKVDGTEEAVLAKFKANFESFKAKGKCTFDFSADIDLKAQLEASASGKASSDEGAKGDAAAEGGASASVNVKIEPKCEAEADVKADLDVTVNAIKVHMPKLLGVAKGYIAFLAKVPELTTKGQGLVTQLVTDLNAVGEVKCAVETLTGFKADLDAKVDFSVNVQASAKGEAKAG
ncbi:MAG: hypothetical protein HY744_13360 [Deltaproteobacteria bacterium]|nr:hypothetical protein [Deltaproteobacteria bacterium]